jgi:hypothetical protein
MGEAQFGMPFCSTGWRRGDCGLLGGDTLEFQLSGEG